jgi:hypothetical protein
MANLTNSTTSLQKATYVPLTVVVPGGYNGRAALKFGYVRQLDLQPGEVTSVRNALSVAAPAVPSGLTDANFWSLLQQFEGTPLVSQLPSPSALTNIAEANLIAFGNGLTAVRKQAVEHLQQIPASTAPQGTSQAPAETQSLAIATNLLNTSSIATNAFTGNTSTSNVGMLNLERLEMTPAGVERGGLLATIPLAPKERTSVVQQEWSVTSQEFTSIVTDSLENYSQTGVTENTQLTQATTSQVAHSNQFNVTSSAQGGIGFVSASVGASFGSQDQSSQSATASRQDAVQMTRQASTRVRQSHKMTISTSTVTGTSQTSTRMFENPSATEPMRVDYFSLMRKWYVALYRYGLRLTYDITVPEPGAALREIYAQIADLQAQAQTTFNFPFSYSDITTQAYNNPSSTLWQYVNEYGAQIQPPPLGATQYVPTQQASTSADPGQAAAIASLSLTFSVTDGQQIDHVEINYNIGANHGSWVISVVGWGQASAVGVEQGQILQSTQSGGGPYYEWNRSNVPLPGFLVGATGSITITCTFQYANPAFIGFNVYTVPTTTTIETWQSSVYTALYNAAQTAYYASQQNINNQIQTLQNKVANVDTLTLRREENDEIMKCVLRWLLGPNFEFMPSSLVDELIIADLFDPEGIYNGVNFTGNDISPEVDWSLVSSDQMRVNFINQAIDWSSVVYFLYSYFWDIPTSWDFIRQIEHPDSTRQAFLRAGSARVVLTVRKGWEVAWTWFVETLSMTPPPSGTSTPYLTIAQQIADYDNTNYPGIPPANPNGGGPIDDDTPQIGTICAANLTPGATATTPVNIPVASSTGFVVGATAIVDNWNATNSAGNSVQETQTITAVPDATHITVQGLVNAHSAANGAFPVVQSSAKGLLIGEWFEYTPTSGTDIAVATPSTTTYCDGGQYANY